MKWIKTAVTGRDNDSTDFIKLITLCVVGASVFAMLLGTIGFMFHPEYAWMILAGYLGAIVASVVPLILSSAWGVDKKQSTEPTEKGQE